jgi:hypothetical protein
MKRRAGLKTLADLLPLFVNETLAFEPGEKCNTATPATWCSA